MSDEPVLASITFADEAAAVAFVEASRSLDTRLVRRINLDGEAATWIVATNLALTALPHLLGFLKDVLTAGKVKRVVVPGVIEIENPTPEQVAKLLPLVSKKKP
jgi:hypothetical protein